MRDKAELEALIERMRAAAAAGDSMGDFARAEGLSRGTVAGIKSRAGIIFKGDDTQKHAERSAEAARRFWGPGGKREHERRHD